MNENSTDENNSSSRKIKRRKRNIKHIEEDNEGEEEKSIKKKLDNNNNRNEKQLEIQKKLKYIFNEVRAKGKYEYNKQEIPEHLKYHSDSDSSEMSMTQQSQKKYIITIL